VSEGVGYKQRQFRTFSGVRFDHGHEGGRAQIRTDLVDSFMTGLDSAMTTLFLLHSRVSLARLIVLLTWLPTC
jgi:uncharacterized protein YfaA (DUF2138 family)